MTSAAATVGWLHARTESEMSRAKTNQLRSPPWRGLATRPPRPADCAVSAPVVRSDLGCQQAAASAIEPTTSVSCTLRAGIACVALTRRQHARSRPTAPFPQCRDAPRCELCAWQFAVLGDVDLETSERQLRQPYREGIEDQLGALGLVVNMLVLWTTLYMDRALAQLRGHRATVNDNKRRPSFSARHESHQRQGTLPFSLSQTIGAADSDRCVIPPSSTTKNAPSTTSSDGHFRSDECRRPTRIVAIPPIRMGVL
jgi:Tn3 transposase DDE domain